MCMSSIYLSYSVRPDRVMAAVGLLFSIYNRILLTSPTGNPRRVMRPPAIMEGHPLFCFLCPPRRKGYGKGGRGRGAVKRKGQKRQMKERENFHGGLPHPLPSFPFHRRPRTTTMGSFLETEQASEYRPDNCIKNPPTTTRTWLFRAIPNTPSRLQLHPMPMF